MASVLVVKEEVALELSLFDLADVATVRGGLVVVEEVYRHPAMVSNSRPLPLSVRFRSIVPQPPHRPVLFVVLFAIVMVLGLAIQLYGVALYRRLRP